MGRALLWAPLAVAASACFFDLPPLADATGTGGAGGGAGATSTATSSSSAGGSMTPKLYELPLSYPSGALPSPVTDVPVPVFLTADRIDYDLAAPTGADLRAFDDQGQPLPLEIELWDASGTSLVWVRLPEMATTGGAFSLRFGDSDVAPGPPPTDVWQGFNAVYHFADADPKAEVRDSAGVFVGQGVDVGAVTTPRGGGAVFDGLTSQIDVANANGWEIPEGEIRTISIWFRRQIDDPTEMPMRTMVPMSNRQPGPSCRGWWMLIFGDSFANTAARINVEECNSTFGVVSNGGLGAGYGDSDWHRFDAVFDRQDEGLYVYTDADLRMAAPMETGLATGDAVAGEARFGAGPPDDINRFEGVIDEARVRVGRPSDAWLRTTFDLENDQILVYAPIGEVE